MSAAARAAAPVMLSRFRGALVGSVLGDCIGGEFEGAVDVPLDRVLQHLGALEDETRGDGDYFHVLRLYNEHIYLRLYVTLIFEIAMVFPNKKAVSVILK